MNENDDAVFIDMEMEEFGKEIARGGSVAVTDGRSVPCVDLDAR